MVAAGAVNGREGWSSKTAFVLAAIGSAVGLGNLWRFPTEAGENGGGAFVLVYIACVILICLPVLLAETLIGRYGQDSPTLSARKLAVDSGASPLWEGVAGVGILTATIVAGFYCVVGGWVLYYVGVFAVDSVSSGVTGGALQGMDVDAVSALFPSLLESPSLVVGLQLLFVVVTAFFTYRGVSKGIELMAVYLMPVFFFLLIAITVYGMFSGAFGDAVAYLFTFEPEKIDGTVVLAALGQAFFSLSLGMAGMMTYGSYVGRDVNLAGTSGVIAAADTGVALLAGLCIFPIVFAAGIAAGAGPGLMFQAIPVAFQSIPGGSLVGLLFFLMVTVAALTSSVALFEVPTAWAMEKFHVSRPKAALSMIALIGALGVFAGLSFNALAEFHPLDFIPIFTGMGMFDILDTLTTKLMIPIGAILVCVLVGWVASDRLVDAENGLSGWLHRFWRLLIRYLSPLALVLILIYGLFA
ncbi:sodium-dependent transporter [Croceicoccus bisphenolivorans]|uniref:sodium-dependent transporter n=1 Tax=Croceicoccus bisphenolivorans TaxID=1783232 RepID=UPI00082B0D93|nr:sodium-dependent transporter [Croceicoccus bisphenolivorans]